MTTPDPTPVAERVTPRWQDPTLPAADRVELLLEQMTLEEKVAQLGSRWIGGGLPDPGRLRPGAGRRPRRQPHRGADAGRVRGRGTPSLEAASRHGLGHLTRIYGSAPVTAVEGAAELVRQQRVVLGASRLGIPALVHEECLTGFTTFGATVYPAAIAWGATFDPGLVERMAAAIGRDMAAVGVHQGLSPVLDVVRDYRWGRVEETMGEDPYLVSVLGAAYVRGLQSAGVIATLKHFAGYSAARAGRNHGPTSMGRRELMDVILPPFETAVAQAGAGSVMNSYSDVDGVPAASDHWLLTDLLREEWGFAGSVVSDYWAVPFLATMHRVAADMDEAGAQALAAGIDVELPDTIGFGAGLAERVRRGELPEALVDRAARRLLTQKVRLGLLDPDWTPEGSVAGAAAVDLDSPANRALAREMAERSVVLLEAGAALPLLGDGRPALRRVAVIGPCAADPRVLMGCYAFPNHVLPRHPGLGLGLEVQTAVDALAAELPGVEIVHEQGCPVQERTGPASGPRWPPPARPTCAWPWSATSPACSATGRPAKAATPRTSGSRGCRRISWTSSCGSERRWSWWWSRAAPMPSATCKAAPPAWCRRSCRGRREGRRSPASSPAGSSRAGSCPCRSRSVPAGSPGRTSSRPSAARRARASARSTRPPLPVRLRRLLHDLRGGRARISDAEVPTDAAFTVSVRVRNTGPREGVEVVQLYLHDVVAQVARPVKQLAGFARVGLAPGEGVDVRFRVHADRTAYPNREFERIVEPGDIEVMVGTSAADLPCRGRVRLTGPLRVVGHGRQLITPVELGPAAGDAA